MAMKKSELSKYFSRLGRKGGKKSGVARLEKLTAEQRSEIARNAAVARWAKVNPAPDPERSNATKGH